jgi:hypothetical protein
VRNAYAVIDEYMRRGRQTAMGLQDGLGRRSFMNDDRSNYGGAYNSPWSSMPPIAEQWMAAMRAWAGLWTQFMPAGWMPPVWGAPGFGTAPPNYGSPAPPVSLQVSANRPTQVMLTIHPGCDALALRLDCLEAQGFSARPIEEVSISRVCGALQVSVRVPPDQPAGFYRGSIHKAADNTPAGELTVNLSKQS